MRPHVPRRRPRRSRECARGPRPDRPKHRSLRSRCRAAPGRAQGAAAAADSARSGSRAPRRRSRARLAATLRPSAASPSVPETQTSSPGRAPLRSSAVPVGTSPIAVSDRVSGPGVDTVSPPRSAIPNAALSAASPAQNSPSHASLISFGRASASRYPSGAAPMAARSDRFTRRSFCAICPGGSSGRKCTPATMASLVSTSCRPGSGVEQRGIVRESESARGSREWPQTPRDELELALRHAEPLRRARGPSRRRPGAAVRPSGPGRR